MALQIEKIKYAGSSKIISALCTKINAVIDAAGSGGGGSITASADATTLTPGSEATATVTQTGDNAVFHFGIPSGLKGDKGDAGTTDYNDLSNKPTRLSDFTDDLVAGHYYPLEGGTILNVGYDDDTPALGLMKIYNANGLATYLYCHEHPNEAWDDGAPLPDSDITVHFPKRSGTIVVDSELRRYLPLTGGTLTGALTTQSDTTNDVIEAATDGHSRSLQIKGRGTASALAYGLLYLGNSTASGTAGNSQGILRLYGSGTAYSNIYSSATSNRNQVLPDKAGTFAMTSDLDDYLPLTGGTLTGNVSINRSDGTTSSIGFSKLSVGNTKASGTNKNSRGQVQIYGTSAYYGVLQVGANTANRTYTLPNASGTIALTSMASTYPNGGNDVSKCPLHLIATSNTYRPGIGFTISGVVAGILYMGADAHLYWRLNNGVETMIV